MKIILVTLLLLISFASHAAKNSAYIKVTGAKQGQFKGESVQRGRENASEILGVSFEAIAPTDPSTGMPAGKRQLRPLTIVKDWGPSSNQYYSALSTNEALREVRIDFFSPSLKGDGMELLERSIVLTDAQVVDVKDSTTSVNGDLQDSETITFVYKKLTITDKSGTIFSDDLRNN